MNPLVFAGGFFIYFPITYLTISVSDRQKLALSNTDISEKINMQRRLSTASAKRQWLFTH